MADRLLLDGGEIGLNSDKTNKKSVELGGERSTLIYTIHTPYLSF